MRTRDAALISTLNGRLDGPVIRGACTVMGFREWGQEKEQSYLSSIPSTPATWPGPVMAIHCIIESVP